MSKITEIISYLLIFFLLFISTSANASVSNEPVWYEKDINNQTIIHLYFFWSKKCPHCLKAGPDIIEIDKQYPWLKLHSLELSEHPENIQTYVNMARVFGNEARSVPTFMFCGNSLSGYENKESTGRLLRFYLRECYQFAKENGSDNSLTFMLNLNESPSVDVPLLGNISSDNYSLPMLTVFIAGMDAFNPCAFFVLLFLLSLMAHTQSRRKMLLIGGVFVFISGAMYFLFMAAWLNLFIYLGELRVITLLAGSVAVLIALINIKDYFWFKKGISLSISMAFGSISCFISKK